jgi:hypothetical protein
MDTESRMGHNDCFGRVQLVSKKAHKHFSGTDSRVQGTNTIPFMAQSHFFFSSLPKFTHQYRMQLRVVKGAWILNPELGTIIGMGGFNWSPEKHKNISQVRIQEYKASRQE